MYEVLNHAPQIGSAPFDRRSCRHYSWLPRHAADTANTAAFDPHQAVEKLGPLASVMDQPIFTSLSITLTRFDRFFSTDIPEPLRGKTLVYDAVTASYVDIVTDFHVSHGTTAGIDVFGISGDAGDGATTMNVNLTGTHSVGANGARLLFSTTMASQSLGGTVGEELTYVSSGLSERLELRYNAHTLSDEHALPAS